MEMKKKNLFLGFCALIYAMFLLFILISNFTARTSEHWRFFYAFTQQSNILALIWFFLFGISAFWDNPLKKIVNNRLLITALTVYLSITFFIVVFILNPVYAGQWNPLDSANEFFLHNLTPVMMWIFFFLVKGIGKPFKPQQCIYILIYPFIYLCVNLAIGMNMVYENGKPAYAYNFVNPSNYPNIFMFIIVIAALIGIFAAFGFGLMKLKTYINREYFDEIETK